MRKTKEQKAITLISLVVTIIILIILAGVSINLVLGENGLITKARRAKEDMEIAQRDEQTELDVLLTQFETSIGESYNETKKVNKPLLLNGMTPIKFSDPTETKMGEIVTTNSSDENWYDYENKKWANAKTQDGSMWVWIPRFAYKIDDRNKKIDVVFLIGTTDTYYEGEEVKTALRQTSIDNVPSTKGSNYVVHPCFTNESSIDFQNGGWDKELTGLWVAKFEAGYASGNNSAPVVASNINYNNYNNYVWVQATERGQSADGNETARNWLDGIYGSTTTAIKYPTFQGTTYSMNYINHNDAYLISRALTDNGNIYGLSSINADSHLIKNSEWGAVAYLGYSKYGTNGNEMTTNNINLNSGNRKRTETAGKSGVDSVFAVTGCTSNTTNTANNIVTIENLNSLTGNTGVNGSNGTAYVWNQLTGTKASNTGTIYGVYDMSGGLWERTASYIANSNPNLANHGKSIAYENNVLKTTSTKYTTIYPNNENGITNIDTASQRNFANNTKIYGDAIRETTNSNAGTSNSGWDTSAWNSDYSNFPGLGIPFFKRGGTLWYGSNAGAFAFHRNDGNAFFNNGFRAVLVAGSAL